VGSWNSTWWVPESQPPQGSSGLRQSGVRGGLRRRDAARAGPDLSRAAPSSRVWSQWTCFSLKNARTARHQCSPGSDQSQPAAVTAQPGTSPSMHSHPISRLTVVSRERLIRRHQEERVPLRVLAAHAGISLRTAYKWLARYRAGGTAALADRRSVRHSSKPC